MLSSFAIVASLLPGFAWLFFYLQQDSARPEPATSIIRTFMAGGVFAFFALLAQLGMKHLGLSLAASGGALVVALVLFSFVEEAAKFWAAWTSTRDDPAFDEPIDAMIYAVVASLGFATVENLGAIAGMPGTYSQVAFLGAVIQATVFRFVGATLLHTLTSAIVGYHWSQVFRRVAGGGFLVAGIVIATALHAVFNYLIIMYGTIAYAIGFVGVIGLFVLKDFEQLKASPR